MIFEITTIETDLGDFIRISTVIPNKDGEYSKVVGENSTSRTVYGRLVYGDMDVPNGATEIHRNYHFHYRYVRSNMSGGTWKNLENEAYITHRYIDDSPHQFRFDDGLTEK